MEPVTVTIVSALAAGALAAAKDVATSAIKDAYAALRRVIADRYQKAGAAVDLVTGDPASNARRAVLAEELEKAGAARDDELKGQAQSLLELIETLRSDTRAAAMFDFTRLRAAKNFELEEIEATGTVLRAEEAEFAGDFKAKGLRQRPPAGSPEKK